MPVIEGLGRLLVPDADASFAEATEEHAPSKPGHVATLIETWKKNSEGQSDHSESPWARHKTTASNLLVHGSIRAEDILDLAQRLSHVESRQNFFSESLESLWDHQHTKPISLEGSRPPTSREMNEEGSKPWSRVVAMGKQMEEMEVTGSHLKLRLEALEQQLCRDVVLQNSTLESLQTQMAEWQEQLTRTVSMQVKHCLNAEIFGQENLSERIAVQVHEQVRREYHRLVLELSDPHSRSNATGGAFQQISRVEDVWDKIFFSKLSDGGAIGNTFQSESARDVVGNP